MYKVSKRTRSEFGDSVIRIIKGSSGDGIIFFDPIDALTAAINMGCATYEVVDKAKSFNLITKKKHKILKWAQKEKFTLKKCARCFSCLKDTIFKSRASRRDNFCTALCALKDELDKPLNDNDETEFEL